MELLPFLYALLAALTGVSAGDRVTIVERAPVSACAVSAAVEQVASAGRAIAIGHRALPQPRLSYLLTLIQPVNQVSLPVFPTARFGVLLL